MNTSKTRSAIAARLRNRRAQIVLTLVGTAAVMLPSTAAAQNDADTTEVNDEASTDETPVTYNGWGGPIVGISPIRGEPGVMFGGMGALVIDNQWAIGAGGAAVSAQGQLDGVETSLSVAWSALYAEYLIQPEEQFHGFAGLFVGGGGAVVGDEADGLEERDAAFFLLHPTAGAEITANEWLRIALMGGFRWVIGANLDSLNDADLSGWTLTAVMRFGGWK